MGPGHTGCDGGVGGRPFQRGQAGAGSECFGKIERFLGEIGEQTAARDARHLEFADANLANVGRVVDVDGAVVRGDGQVSIVLGK